MTLEVSIDPENGPQRSCPKCTEPLPSGGNFCSNCGTRVVDPSAAIDRYVIDRIDSELASRLKDQVGITREVAVDAEDVIIKRFRNYTVLIAAFFVVLGFLGYKSVTDVLNRFQPLLDSAEGKIKKINADTQAAETKIVGVRKSLDTVSSSAREQADRLNLRNGEISQRLGQLDTNRKKAEQLSIAYQDKLKEVSDKIDKMEKDLNGRVQQVVERATDLQISQVYPSLGQKTFLTFNGKLWKGAADKRATEIWIDIAVNNWAFSDYTQEDIRALTKKLDAEKYRSFIGYAGTGGATSVQDALVFRAQVPTVYYFDDAKRSLAENIAAIATKSLHVNFSIEKSPNVKALGLTSPIKEQQEYIFEHSGLDFEIVLALKPRD